MIPEEIARVPVDGRDVLNTAQFEPGLVVQDGGTLDPTKSGNFALSINQASGQDTLYTLDGVDLNDETKGGITQNVALSSVQEMVVRRAMFPSATGLTSSGEVSMISGSGGTGLHGEAFGLFRDQSIGFARAPGGQDLNFQRTDFGGKLGGTLIQDKAFFFLDAEHVTQDAHRAVVLPSPFQAFTGSYSSPFRNTSATGKLDWQPSAKYPRFLPVCLQLEQVGRQLRRRLFGIPEPQQLTVARGWSGYHARSLRSQFSRFGYLRYHNSGLDAGGQAGAPGALGLPASIQFTDLAGGQVQFGPSRFAPQETLQENKEFRYDGVSARRGSTYCGSAPA